jgi:DNA invertase Pin-like site-specific DNA recombinase
MKICYARVSTNEQDLTAQRDGLAALGVDAENVYVDHGLTGANRARPGLREAMAAVRKGGSVYDPTNPVGRLLFNVLGMVAEFEADLIRMRTREGMAVARAKGRLRGKQPKLSASQRRHLLELHDAGNHTQEELAELFSVSRTTIYREVQRRAAATSAQASR